jgi:predicted ArsR family transcriptional regulator
VEFPGEASERVARNLLEHGPQTAAELAELLSMTSAGVRRHLAALVEGGFVVAHERVPYGPAPKRGRGRPGNVFTLTAHGRAACGSSSDDLALAALRYLAAEHGAEAVVGFARDRARSLADQLNVGSSGSPEEVAAALTSVGYAAEVQPLGDLAVQLCQHNCPVVGVAREFPEICEAETAELARLLNRHVTRLATLAHGDEVCTTVIPLSPSTEQQFPRTSPHRTQRRVSA